MCSELGRGVWGKEGKGVGRGKREVNGVVPVCMGWLCVRRLSVKWGTKGRVCRVRDDQVGVGEVVNWVPVGKDVWGCVCMCGMAVSVGAGTTRRGNGRGGKAGCV